MELFPPNHNITMNVFLLLANVSHRDSADLVEVASGPPRGHKLAMAGLCCFQRVFGRDSAYYESAALTMRPGSRRGQQKYKDFLRVLQDPWSREPPARSVWICKDSLAILSDSDIIFFLCIWFRSEYIIHILFLFWQYCGRIIHDQWRFVSFPYLNTSYNMFLISNRVVPVPTSFDHCISESMFTLLYRAV